MMRQSKAVCDFIELIVPLPASGDARQHAGEPINSHNVPNPQLSGPAAGGLTKAGDTNG